MPKNSESPSPPDGLPAKANGAPAAQPVSGASREVREASDPTDHDSRSFQPQATSPASPIKHNLSQRKGQYLIAARRLSGMQTLGLQPLQFNMIEQTLRSSPDIEIVDTVGPKNIIGALADGMSEVPSVLVARMTDEKANVLHQQAQGRLIVERDHPLTMADAGSLPPSMVACSIPTTGVALTATFIVLGKSDQPLADAEVYLFGSLIPATGVTDAQGQVVLSLYGETTQTIRGLYVKPKADYWSFYQQDPDIDTDEPNVVGLKTLSDWHGLANFPQQQAFGWGQKAMRLDYLPENFRGQGIRVAIIDSGAATTHDDLKKIRFGFDIINKKTTPGTWNEDLIAHGSHCAGVIAGFSDRGIGIRGFAPDAEVHACKLFPGGQVSQLIDALEYCIEKQIDVVNLSLGGAEPSEALEQQILRAKRAGIACIVAAGNSGGPVQYPGSSPNVLAVAAIGKLNEFPQDSYHTQSMTQPVDANGFFSPKFTCHGPQIAVCAPGVAITSSVPVNNYAVWDGTSMAAPHVSGLAALVLAHHPDFQNAFKARSAERVDRLFQIIKASSYPINLGDPGRTGFGLPDVLVAVGLQPQMGIPTAMFQQTGVPIAQGRQAMSGLHGNLPFGTHVVQQSAESFAPADFSPLSAAYAEQAQAAQAQMGQQPGWFGNPWPQVGQSIGPQAFSSGFDPAYAALLSTYLGRAPIGALFGYSPPPLGRTNW